MKNPRRYVAHAAFAAVVGVGSALILISPNTALGDDPASRVDADGTLHIRDLTIPPSDLLSPESRKAARDVESSGCLGLQRPLKRHAKVEWDHYATALDCMLAPVLAWDLEHYPVKVVDTTIAGVHVGIISPKDGIAPGNQRRILINLHGGGFVEFRGLGMGQLESIPVAAIGRIKVITVDYRQAPEYRYPAASEDVEAIYREMLKQYKPEAIGVFGCSAGGALTAQAVAWIRAKGLPRPGAAGIFCYFPPTTPRLWDAGGDSQMWLTAYLSAADKAALEPLQWYMEDADVHDPQAYPGLSDAALANFPPTLLLTGTRAYEMSPVVVAHARLLKLGVDSSLYVMEGFGHAAHVLSVATPEAHDANAYIAHWFDRHLAR